MSKVEELEIDPLYWKLQIGSKVENLTYPDYCNHYTQLAYLTDPDSPSIYFSEKTPGDTDRADSILFFECYNLGYSDWLKNKYFGPEQTKVPPGQSHRYDAYYKGQKQAQLDYNTGSTYSHPIFIPESCPKENHTGENPPIPKEIYFCYPNNGIIDI